MKRSTNILSICWVMGIALFVITKSLPLLLYRANFNSDLMYCRTDFPPPNAITATHLRVVELLVDNNWKYPLSDIFMGNHYNRQSGFTPSTKYAVSDGNFPHRHVKIALIFLKSTSATPPRYSFVLNTWMKADLFLTTDASQCISESWPAKYSVGVRGSKDFQRLPYKE